jgi:hypothetical protein
MLNFNTEQVVHGQYRQAINCMSKRDQVQMEETLRGTAFLTDFTAEPYSFSAEQNGMDPNSFIDNEAAFSQYEQKQTALFTDWMRYQRRSFQYRQMMMFAFDTAHPNLATICANASRGLLSQTAAKKFHVPIETLLNLQEHIAQTVRVWSTARREN